MQFEIRIYTHQIHFVYKGKELQTSFTSYNRSPSLTLSTKWLHSAGIDGIVTKIHTINLPQE